MNNVLNNQNRENNLISERNKLDLLKNLNQINTNNNTQEELPVNAELQNIIKQNKNNIFQKNIPLFHTYDTLVTDLLANPIKKSIIYVIIIILLGLIFKHFEILKFVLKIHTIEYYGIILLFIGCFVAINQYTLNKNIEYMLNQSQKNLTIFEFNPNHTIPESNLLKLFISIFTSTAISQFLSFNLQGFELINTGIAIGI